MKNILVCALILLLGVPFTGNCETYLEQQTPAGQVEGPQHSGKTAPYRNKHDNGAPPVTPMESAQTGPLKAESKFSSNSIFPPYKQAYNTAGTPRIAIFMNRTLSDEVREWYTGVRGVVSLQGEFVDKDKDKESSFKGPGGASVYAQQHIENNTARSNPSNESWMWRFEEGFMAPFIDTRTKVVDRATIMRLTAAKSGQQGNTYDPMTVKKVEMDALLDKADLFVELLVRKDPKSQVGYAFKATAKEIKTGIILANVTSLDWDYSAERESEKVVPTSDGYEFVTETEKADLPDINVVSRDLALALMRSLTNSWQ